VANVGDSRLYLIGHEINQVTEDHSYVAAMMRAGELTEEQARNHPEKNVITRAIGVAWEVKADFFEVDLKPGDMFRLMVKFDFNFMINSQILWGDYDTVPALAIYHLVRPENAKYVTVIRYVWNGNIKSMVTEKDLSHG